MEARASWAKAAIRLVLCRALRVASLIRRVCRKTVQNKSGAIDREARANRQSIENIITSIAISRNPLLPKTMLPLTIKSWID